MNASATNPFRYAACIFLFFSALLAGCDAAGPSEPEPTIEGLWASRAEATGSDKASSYWSVGRTSITSYGYLYGERYRYYAAESFDIVRSEGEAYVLKDRSRSELGVSPRLREGGDVLALEIVASEGGGGSVVVKGEMDRTNMSVNAISPRC